MKPQNITLTFDAGGPVVQGASLFIYRLAPCTTFYDQVLKLSTLSAVSLDISSKSSKFEPKFKMCLHTILRWEM